MNVGGWGMMVEVCIGRSLDGGEVVSGEGQIGAWGGLMVVEEAVVIAVGRHKRFEFRWDGWEKVAAKGDVGRGSG